MSRFRAATIHLLISMSIVSAIFVLIFFVWYPTPTFQIAGAANIVFMLIAVDLVLGPLLTLIVFKENKWGMKFDLTVIALVQLAALVYGTSTLYQERPYYMVFIVDRFNLVSEKHIDKSQLRFAELQEKPFADVIKVFARMPEGDEFQQYLDSVMFEGEADLEGRPEFWEPYANGVEIILAASKPLADLVRTSDEDERRVQHIVDKYQADHPRLGYLPVGTLSEDIGMVMDMDTAEPVDIVKVSPW